MADYPDPTMSSRDLERTYAGCYGRINDKVVFINRIVSNDAYEAFWLKDGHLKEFSAKNRTDIKITDIDFEVPEFGVFNTVRHNIPTTVLLFKKAERQWKRGFVGKATHRFLDYTAFRTMGNRFGPVIGLERSLIETIFAGTYPQFDDAIKELKEDKAISRAINRHISIHQEIGLENYAVRYLGRLVGHYDAEKHMILLHPAMSHLIQEFTQYAPTEVFEL